MDWITFPSQLIISIIANLISAKITKNTNKSNNKSEIFTIDEIIEKIDLVDLLKLNIKKDIKIFNVDYIGATEYYETMWNDLLKNNKSLLIKGSQGAGKTSFAKGFSNHLNSKNTKNKNGKIIEDKYKIRWIKTWDYDYDNTPTLLFLKKILNLNILCEEDNKKLQLLIWLYNNENKISNMPQHIIVDTTKTFIKNAKINSNNIDTNIIIILDELERCLPKFALELLEIMTTYNGVECSIDKHSCDWNTKDKDLLINKIKLIWIFDKKILTTSIMNIYGNKKPHKVQISSFWNKYIENEIDVLSIKYNNLIEHLYKNNIIQNTNSISNELEYIIKQNIENISDWREVNNKILYLKQNLNILSINHKFYTNFCLGKIFGNFNVYKLNNIKMNEIEFEQKSSYFNSMYENEIVNNINNYKQIYSENINFKDIEIIFTNEFIEIKNKINNKF